MNVRELGLNERGVLLQILIKALLTQPEVGASKGLIGLGDIGSDCNFLNDE